MKKSIKTIGIVAMTGIMLVSANLFCTMQVEKTKVQAVEKTVDVLPDGQINSNVEIFYTNTENDFRKLHEALKNRDGKVIIEISYGIVTDNKGNGKDALGYYRHYDTKRFAEGDKVQSVFVYNPDNNCVDDILYRIDTVVE